MASKRWFEEHLKRGCRREGVLGRGDRRIVTVVLLCVVSFEFLGSWDGSEGKRGRVGRRYVPFASSSSPAVSSARVASLGRWSRTTEAAIVMGRVASVVSASGSGGTEEGEGGDVEGEFGWGEAMVVCLVGLFGLCCVSLVV